MSFRLAAVAVILAAAPASAAWEAERATPAQLKAAMDAKQAITIVDVRSPQAFAQSHLPGAINVPWAGLRQGAKPPATLRKDRVAYLYCT